MPERSDRPQSQADADGFVFADYEELDGVIGDWRTERDDIHGAEKLLAEAYLSTKSPAGDEITHDYLAALRDACMGYYKYNRSMSQYTEEYLQRLMDCRQVLGATEDANTAAFTWNKDI